MKLYEISDNYNAFLRAIEAGEIEDEQAIADTLESIEGSFDDKVNNVANIIQQYELSAKALKEKADTIAARAKKMQRDADGLKWYLTKNMLAVGRESFESAENKIFFLRSEQVNVHDESAFVKWAQENGHPEYVTVKAAPAPTANKTAIKNAIKAGAEVAGAEIVVKQNIQIK